MSGGGGGGCNVKQKQVANKNLMVPMINQRLKVSFITTILPMLGMLVLLVLLRLGMR